MDRHPSVLSRILITALIAGIGLLAVQPPAWAQERPRPDRPHPDDYFFAEFISGGIGGALGVSVLEQFFAQVCADAEDPQLCWSLQRSGFRPVAYPLLVFIGSSAGIVTAGSLAGVEGNLTATLIGDFLGAYAGMVIASLLWQVLLEPLFEPGAAEALVEPEETPEYLRRTFPLFMRVLRPHEEMIKNTVYIAVPILFATSFGTQGFNVGAELPPRPASGAPD